jgi:hypothetical protein
VMGRTVTHRERAFWMPFIVEGVCGGPAVRRRVVWSSRDVVRYGQNHDRMQR